MEEVFNYKLTRRKQLRKRIISPIKEFFTDSKSIGILLLICTICSLVLSNLSWSSATYIAFWEKETHSIIEGLHFPHTIYHWINDFFMAFYFFLVSMEIKRELTIGELSSMKKATLPLMAAIGGMIIPALIYFACNIHTEYALGWGIPMATDIAFSLGILSLLGKRVPLSLKILLMALAIIDDLGGILTIALFYTNQIDMHYLYLALITAVTLIIFNRIGVKRTYPYFLVACLLWYFIFNSGVHATLAGVILGFTIPLRHVESLESALHDPVNFIIMPIFALANTAVILPVDILSALLNTSSIGIILGLVIGKPVGITLFSWISVKLKFSELPNSLNWKYIIGMGMLGGIGFTISIFISSLAFQTSSVKTDAVLAIILASMLAGIVAYIYLSRLGKSNMIIEDNDEYDYSDEYDDVEAIDD